jgi:hypothetical protein
MPFLHYSYLCTKHHTSKAQYEYQLKKWGIRKYRKKEQPRVNLDLVQWCPSAVSAVTSLRDRFVGELPPHGSLASNKDRSGAPNRGNAQYLSDLILCTDIAVAPIPRTFGTIARIASPPYHVTRTPTQSRPNTPFMTWCSSLDDLSIPGPSSSGALNISNSAFSFPHPFSWTRALDWGWIKTFIKDNDAIIRYPDAQSMRLAALSYETNPISTICATSDTTANFAQYLVFALLNNMVASSKLDPDGICSWLGKLPQPVICQFLKALPPGHSDVLRERIFVAAMNAEDAATVTSALESGFDIHQVVDFGSHTGPQHPLVIASTQCDYPVARTIVAHASRVVHTHQLDDVLNQLISGFEGHDDYHRDCPNKCSAFKWSGLLLLLLNAGANFTIRCLKVAVDDDTKLVRRILDCEDVQIWMEANILSECLQWKSRSMSRRIRAEFDANPHIRLIYSYILEEKLDEIQSHNPASTDALRKAFRGAIYERCVWAVDMTLAAALHLGIVLGSLAHNDITNGNITNAHRDSDWTLLEELTQEWSTGDRQMTQHNAQRRPEDHAILACESLISDWDLLLRRLDDYKLCDHPGINKYDILCLLALGCSPDFDSILVALALKLDRENLLEVDGVIELLLRARVTAISQLVSQQEYWRHTLLCLRTQHDFDALDDLIYRKRTDSTFFRTMFEIAKYDVGIGPEQIVIRALAYYAIDTNNDMLLRWLLKEEYSTGEAGQSWGDYPSFLAVAASRNNAYMTQLLLDEGVESNDSRALMWAVAGDADNVVIEILLAAVGQVQCKRNYGGAALRMAIHRKNYHMLCLLSTAVDVNSIESLDIELSGGREVLNHLSPLGEAVCSRDMKAAEILIKNGADVCRLFNVSGYGNHGHLNARGTYMGRMSTLLAAIDTENLSMVKFLVENGADINHSFRTGLIRRPLQRAAEIGNFEIVQYLLQCGAPADCAPCYSGGTALQLTAIGGYVGIAELLLEYGADINHLPAEGEGRTAFEGAAEWGRVDMMCLLVWKGLNFDLVVDKEGHTQSQRAMQFAEKRGQMASKRFVEYLRKESTVDSINWSVVMGG